MGGTVRCAARGVCAVPCNNAMLGSASSTAVLYLSSIYPSIHLSIYPSSLGFSERTRVG